jgi:hypothetical protein
MANVSPENDQRVRRLHPQKSAKSAKSLILSSRGKLLLTINAWADTPTAPLIIWGSIMAAGQKNARLFRNGRFKSANCGIWPERGYNG